jgi:hypothetical protein
MQPLSANGRPLRAEFRVEPTDPWPSVVLESRSGSARNPDYHPALTVILARLRQLGATLEDAIVDSTVSRRLPYEERRLHLRQRAYPVTLRDEADVDDLRRAIGAAQAPVAQRKGAKGGNRHKRIRLYVSGLDDYEDDLQTRLAAGGSASDAVRAAADAIGGPRRTRRHREGRRGSGQGRGLTAEQRRVVELHAMDVVTESLVAKGWTVVDISDEYRGYDLLATRQDEELHVESKGTTGGGASVLVTRGEVAYAREHSQHVQLSIVSGIELSQADDGRWVASGGSERRIRPWHPDDSVLEPVGYEWLVPPE